MRFSATGADTSAAAVPFDFSADGGHLVVADWANRPGRLVVLRTADGALERTVDGVGRVDSIASFDAVPIAPTTPLFSAPGPIAPVPAAGALAIISQNGDTLTTVDMDTGRQHVVHLSDLSLGTSDDTLPRLVALDGGFVWIRAGEAWFASTDGGLVSLGLANYVVPGRTPAEAWTVRRSDNGYEIMQVDGRTGVRGPDVRVGRRARRRGARRTRHRPAGILHAGKQRRDMESGVRSDAHGSVTGTRARADRHRGRRHARALVRPRRA